MTWLFLEGNPVMLLTVSTSLVRRSAVVSPKRSIFFYILCMYTFLIQFIDFDPISVH